MGTDNTITATSNLFHPPREFDVYFEDIWSASGSRTTGTTTWNWRRRSRGGGVTDCSPPSRILYHGATDEVRSMNVAELRQWLHSIERLLGVMHDIIWNTVLSYIQNEFVNSAYPLTNSVQHVLAFQQIPYPTERHDADRAWKCRAWRANGGYVMLRPFSREKIVCSFGICDDVSWGIVIAKNGYQIYQYDHTINCLQEEYGAFHWHKLRLIVYPPVKMIAGGGTKDGRQILICGRFNRDKKTDILVNAFNASEFLSENARLVVAGSAVGEDGLFIEELRRGSPQNVSFVLDPNRETLERLYSSSSFFWHAMGLGTEEPSKFEHFGITTVEAMSAGCVPIVINKGGQKESVEESCGIRWDTVEELVENTVRLIKNPAHTASLRQKCVERAKMFSTNSFRENVRKIFSELGYA